MPVRFSCPECGRNYSVSSKHTGKSTRCLDCNHKVSIPEPPAVKAAPAPEEPFAGMGVEDLLGALPSEDAAAEAAPPMGPSGFTLPGEEAWTPRRPRAGSMGAAGAAAQVMLGGLAGRGGAVSPMGVLLTGTAGLWLLLSLAVPDAPNRVWWVLPLAVMVIGLLLVGRGLLGMSRSEPYPLGPVALIIAAAAPGLALLAAILASIAPSTASLAVPLAVVLAVLAAGLFIIANLWQIVLVAREGIGHLLACWVVPFYALYYILSRWDDQKRPVTVALGAACILMLSGGLLGFASEGAAREAESGGGSAAVAGDDPEVTPASAGPRLADE